MPSIEQISLYLGIVASVLGIIGFPLALWSLQLTKQAADESAQAAKKSKDASEKAREEVANVRRDLKLVASIAGLERALATMNDIKAFLRHSTFEPVPDKISLLIQCLNELRTPNQELSEEDVRTIQSAIAALRKIESFIDGTPTEAGKRRPQFISRITTHIDKLQPILMRLRDLIGAPK